MNTKCIAFIVFLLLFSSKTAFCELDEKTPLSRIAFGACAFQDLPQHIWKGVTKWNPELFLFLGDSIYVNTIDMNYMADQYRKLGENPYFSKLRSVTPILAIWDDNDYGKNDGGADYYPKHAAQKIFLDFFNEPADSERRKRSGVYISKMVGPEDKRIQVILLDTRFFRSPLGNKQRASEKKYLPNPEEASTILGEEQWTWLKDELKKSAKVRIIASSIQIINDEHGSESWGNFPKEREKLYKIIRDTSASGVLILSGDRHFSELSKKEVGIGYPLHDFTSSGLTHSSIEGIKIPNSHRVGIPFGGKNFGSITIDWNKPDPSILLETRDVEGESKFNYSINLSSITAAK